MWPIQYQQGYVEFYKLKFKVNPDVLIPRPESELLVDEVLNYLKNTKSKQLTAILDVGTGSGCLAISIAKNLFTLPTWNVGRLSIKAFDISKKALMVARQNARLHRVQDKITFIHSNLLQYYDTSQYHSDNVIIVANLPYIPSGRIPDLDESVKDFEPLTALDGGVDGFELYRKLFGQIAEKKIKPQLIVCEIDYTQGELAAIEAQKYFPKALVEVKKDLAKKQRVLLLVGQLLQGCCR